MFYTEYSNDLGYMILWKYGHLKTFKTLTSRKGIYINSFKNSADILNYESFNVIQQKIWFNILTALNNTNAGSFKIFYITILINAKMHKILNYYCILNQIKFFIDKYIWIFSWSS